MIALHAHQVRAIDQICDAWRTHRSALCVMPTGAGKTRVACELVRARVTQSRHALIVVHRQELVAQTIAALQASGVAESSATVASVQSLLARPEYEWPSADLLIIDEAHHYVSAEWCRIPRAYRCATLGLTATPERSDGRPLGDLFEVIVAPVSARELIEIGVLTPCVVYAPKSRKRALAARPHEALLERRGEWTRAIIFAANIEHAVEVTADCNASGLRASAIHHEMSALSRAQILKCLAAGELDVVVNVFALTEGFDLPSIDACVLARGCSHHGAYLQMIGRAIRAAPGKTRATIFDLVGAVHDHGLPDADRAYALEGEAISGAPKGSALRQCRACGAVFEPGPGACVRCGEPLPPPPKPKLSREQLSQVFQSHPNERRESAWHQLCAIARARGYKPGWARYQFKARYGHWPKFGG